MKKEGLVIASYPLKPEVLNPIKIWGFKLKESFMDLLLSIQMLETPNRKYPGYLAGRTALKAVVSHHPKDVIQFHANLEVIKRNENYWFYTHTPIEFEMAAAYINDWLRKECRAKNLKYTPTNWQEWGYFEELALSDFLDNERFRNGNGVLGRYFLLQLTKQPLPFVTDSSLQFYPVISEGKNIIMTTPYFSSDAGPLSFAITSTIQQIPNQVDRFLEFNTQVKIWVQENSIQKKGRYFHPKTATNLYLYNPELTEQSAVVFNQMSLKLIDKEPTLVNKADQYYCEQNDIQIIPLLDKELHSFELNSGKFECQVLLTVPNDARGDLQKLSGKEEGVPHASYGLGLLETEALFDSIAQVLEGFNLKHLPRIMSQSTSTKKTVEDFQKEDMFPKYGMEHLIITQDEYLKAIERKEIQKNTKLIKSTKISKEAFYHRSKKVVKIGYATTSSLMASSLIGHVRMLLRADTQLDEKTYSSEDQLKVQFVELPMALSEPFSDKPLSSEFGRRSRLVKEVGEGLDGAFIEIEPMKDQKKDSKHYLRTEFSKQGIPLQFFHPTKEKSNFKLKSDVVNRGKACTRDLLSKMGFVDSKLQTIFNKNPEKTILSISKVNLKNRLRLPCLTKVTAEDSWIKIYPNKQWVKIEDLSKEFSHCYIDNIDSLFNNKYDEHLPLVQMWLKNELNEFETASDLLIYWDEAIETLLPFFDLCDFDQFIQDFLPFNLNNGLLIRWKNSTKAPDYVNRKYKKKADRIEVGQYMGIYPHPMTDRCYYLIGERLETIQGKKDTLKKDNYKKTLTTSGMHQCYLYPDVSAKEAIEVLQLTQLLRRMVVTQNITASVPYPLYLVRHLNEQIESFAIRYVKDEEDK